MIKTLATASMLDAKDAELVERLRAFAAGCRGSMWQSRDETIRLCDEAASLIQSQAARIAEMETFIEKVRDFARESEDDGFYQATDDLLNRRAEGCVDPLNPGEALGNAIRRFESDCKAAGGYMPVIATLLRLHADEMADKYPDDTNGGRHD